jgi:hypothetical protein
MRARVGQMLGPHGELRVCNVDEVRQELRREVFHDGDNELRDQLGRPLSSGDLPCGMRARESAAPPPCAPACSRRSPAPDTGQLAAWNPID